MNRRWVSFYLDAGLFVAVIVLEAGVVAVNIAMHEWLGLAFIAVMLVHLVLSWPWIASRTAQFRVPRAPRVRVNYLLNAALFVSIVVALHTGIVISRSALPTVGIRPTTNEVWADVHAFASNLAVALIGLHIAMNWKWIAGVLRDVVRPVPQPVVAGVRGPGTIARLVRALPRSMMPSAALLSAAGVVVLAGWGTVRLFRPVPMRQEEQERRERRRSSPARTAGTLGQEALLVAGAAVAGRKVLRIRL